MNTYHIYGIKNCDTVKKALNWLDKHSIDYIFHDYKHTGLSSQQLKQFTQLIDWKTLLNTRSLTYRNLDLETKGQLNNLKTATTVMLTYPLIIKRPILVKNNQALIGFSPEKYQHFITND